MNDEANPAPPEFVDIPYRSPPWVRFWRATILIVVMSVLGAYLSRSPGTFMVGGGLFVVAAWVGPIAIWGKWFAACPSCGRNYNMENKKGPIHVRPLIPMGPIRLIYNPSLRSDRTFCDVCGYQWNAHRMQQIESGAISTWFALPQFLDRYHYWILTLLGAAVFVWFASETFVGALFAITATMIVLLIASLVDRKMKAAEDEHDRR